MVGVKNRRGGVRGTIYIGSECPPTDYHVIKNPFGYRYQSSFYFYYFNE